MQDKTRPLILGFITGFSIVAGLFLAFWCLTVGLMATLYSYGMNKDASAFLFLVIGLVFSLLLLTGGIGTKRRWPAARVLFMVCYALALVPIIGYMVGELFYGFSKDGLGSEFFDVGSWLGGLIFWSLMATLLVLIIRFLKSNKTTELFKDNREKH